MKKARKGSFTEIICGFPGVGKSYAMKLDDPYNCFFMKDSDSSTFDKSDFPRNYIESIKKEIGDAEDTYTRVIILASSHKVVREELVKEGIHFTLVYPNIKLRGEYIQRYTNRNSPEAFLKLLFDNWNAWITECKEQTCCDHIELGS
jgi:hypothetical protein